jgi:hypothetical protein
MDEDAVLMAIGGLTEAVKNQGREIGEIKGLLKCKSADCIACRKEIDGEIATLKETHTGERAVRSWKDKTLGEVGVIAGAFCGILAVVVWVIRGTFTGDWT